jgi:hypothetical protein
MKFLFSALLFFFLGAGLQAQAQITREELDQVFTVFHQVYDAELTAKKAKVVFNLPDAGVDWWTLEDLTASYNGMVDPQTGFITHDIFFFGGLARMPKMSRDGAAQILCHEMGHAIGGAPYKLGKDHNVSIEPQADYFSTQSCLRRVFALMPGPTMAEPLSPWVEQHCAGKYSDASGLQWCYRAFQALESERNYFRLARSTHAETSYETPDPTVVDYVNLNPEYYPSAQCRLDTLAAGTLGEPRPRCWFAP